MKGKWRRKGKEGSMDRWIDRWRKKRKEINE